MKPARIIFIFSVCIFYNAYGNDSICRKKLPEKSLKGYHFIYMNPVRSLFDDFSMYYEFQWSEKFASCVSLGYKKESPVLAALYNRENWSYPRNPNKVIMHLSNGPLVRAGFKYQKFAGNGHLNYFALFAQYNYLKADHIDISYEPGNMQSGGVMTISRENHIGGMQAQFGQRIFSNGSWFWKCFTGEWFMGAGLNIENYRTQYHAYRSYSSESPEGSVISLKDDQGTFFKPVFYLGFRVGVWFRRSEFMIER